MRDSFHFGLEAEFCLAQASDFKPLWYRDVTFNQLDSIFKEISLEGIPSLEGLSAEPPHTKLMPFIVEGYGVPDEQFNIIDAYPKGIEIRTPVCSGLHELFDVYELLYRRVKKALGAHNLIPIAISHHPTETEFSGPQNKRRHDFWLWAMEVMTTFGPDINVSFPDDLSKKLFSDKKDLHAKVNYYAPAMAAISLASPFYNGAPWNMKGGPGKSFRTFKRSIVAPAIEIHEDENNRIEFKVFEMSRDIQDFQAYFLLVLTLFLDDSLKGRSSHHERIYDLGGVSRFGLNAEGMRARFLELYERAYKILPAFGFKSDGLDYLIQRIELNTSPSDEMLRIFHETQSIPEVLKEFSYLKTLRGERI